MTLFWTILGFFAFMYIGTPVLIRFSQTMSAKPQFVAMDPKDFPAAVSQYISATAHELVALGFTVSCYLEMANQVPNVAAYLALLVNRETGDKAMITAMFSTVGGKPVLQTKYLEFSTRYISGSMVDTSNSATLNSFQPSSRETKTQLPSVQSTQELFRLHQFIMSRAARGEQKTVYGEGEAIAYLTRGMIEDYEQQAKFGRLFLDQGASVYRPTWKGAYLMTWGLLWPISAIRKSRIQQKEKQLLSEFRSAAPPVATQAGWGGA